MESITSLVNRYPSLSACQKSIETAAEYIISAYKNGSVLFTAGNGGSAADADHIVGELMKGFMKRRALDEKEINEMASSLSDGERLARSLQKGLPAISLHSQSALLTAFMNDAEPEYVYAQVLYAMGKKDDVLIAISTSGNSKNIVNAVKVARHKGMKIISLTGERRCALDSLSDVVIHVQETETYRVQELHLPVYHWICARIEDEFFDE